MSSTSGRFVRTFRTLLLLTNVAFVFSIRKLPVFDYDSVPILMKNVRFKRGADYGDVGGPIAASELPNSISGAFGPKPELPRVAGQCKMVPGGGGACFFNMKAHQILKLDEKVAQPFAIIECNDSVECLNQCIKQKCNYFVRSNLPSQRYVTHLYKLDDEVIQKARYVPAISFDSSVQSCIRNEGRQKRRAKRALAAGRFGGDWWDCWEPEDDGSKRKRRRKREWWWWWNWHGSPDHPDNEIDLSECFYYGGKLAGELQAVNAAAAANQAAVPPVIFDPCGLADLFSQYGIHYDKAYVDETEVQERSQTFCDNIKRMHELNLGAISNKSPDDAKCGITNFADETTKNFVKIFTGAQSHTGAEKCDLKEEDVQKLRDGRGSGAADKHDWREFGVIPPIRYQGQCGSCYAFATSDLVAIQNAVQNRIVYGNELDTRAAKVETLSSQYMVDCSPKKDAMGCKGGRPLNILKALINDTESGGIPLASCYKYKGKKGSCRAEDLACCERSRVTDARMLDVRGKYEKDIMAALLKNGPVVAVVDANEFWQFHNGTGVIKSYQCSTKKQTHAVVVVGYDYSVTSRPYYIIRNSWNNDWGEQGYAKLEAGADACGVAKTVITSCARDCDHFKKDVKDILFKSLENQGHTPSMSDATPSYDSY